MLLLTVGKYALVVSVPLILLCVEVPTGLKVSMKQLKKKHIHIVQRNFFFYLDSPVR